MTTQVTTHAAARLAERLHISEDSADKHFEDLWRRGHSATPSDFDDFHTQRLPGRQYRVARYEGQAYLIVRCKFTGKFITVFHR